MVHEQNFFVSIWGGGGDLALSKLGAKRCNFTICFYLMWKHCTYFISFAITLYQKLF